MIATVAEPASAATRELAVPQPANATLGWLTPNDFQAALQIAELMAKCGTMPAHLKTPADCFRIVVQAAKWRIDPYSVAECTSLVHGRLCYEGKLVAAVLYSLGAIEGRFHYEITGEGQASSIVVTATPRGTRTPVSVKGTVAQWRTRTMKDGKELPNNWDKNPHDQLVYRGTRQWARIHAPDGMLGVYTKDEVEDLEDVTHTATVVPESTKAKGREVPAESTPSTATVEASKPPASDGPPPLFSVDELVTKVKTIAGQFGAEGMAAIKKFNTRLSIKRTQECPPDQVGEAMKILATFERELHETGKVAP